MKKKLVLVLIVFVLIVVNYFKYLSPPESVSANAEEISENQNGRASGLDYGVASLKLPNIDKLFTFQKYKTEKDLFNYYQENDDLLQEKPEDENDLVLEIEEKIDPIIQLDTDVEKTEVLAVSHHSGGSTALIKINGKIINVKVGDVLSTGHIVSGIEGTSISVKEVVAH